MNLSSSVKRSGSSILEYSKLNSDLVNMASSTTHGKVIITGEHSVVYGSLAFAVPLSTMPLTLKLNFSSNRSPCVRINSNECGIAEENLCEYFQGLLQKVDNLLQVTHIPTDVDCSSNLPIGVGLGSSAALSVALVNARAEQFNFDLSVMEVIQLATQIESCFHGRSSGLDTAVVSHAKAILFRRENEVIDLTELEMPQLKRVRLVLLNSGARSNTSSIVELAKSYFVKFKKSTLLKTFDEITLKALDGFTNDNVENLASAMNEMDSHLVEAGVNSARLQDIKDYSRNLGVKAIKITGAGQGGCLLALLDPTRVKEQYNSICEYLGAHNVYKVN